MTSYHIIPDIHGHADKLTRLLDRIGWQRTASGWRGPVPGARLAFLGDFIDRGPENGAVLATVRDLMDGGHAVAVMGNHELNAIHYHHFDDDTGQPLRPHSDDNTKQHSSFLNEFPLGSVEAGDWIDWMKTLPLWLDTGEFRMVHACWSPQDIDTMAPQAEHAQQGCLPPALIVAAGKDSHPLNGMVETVTKGPEVPLPPGYFFADGGGNRRERVRHAWWRNDAETWAEGTVSVPDDAILPPGQMPPEAIAMTYDKAEKPVFFGHYWMTGDFRIESENALCLDYSAGRDGPLIAYRFEPGDTGISRDRVIGFD